MPYDPIELQTVLFMARRNRFPMGRTLGGALIFGTPEEIAALREQEQASS